MAQRIPIPEDIVALIKAIVNQDRREREAAGFKQGTTRLARRIAAELGLTLTAVQKIKQRKRRKHVLACRLAQTSTTRDPAELEEIRQRRIQDGVISEAWKGRHHGPYPRSPRQPKRTTPRRSPGAGQDR